MKAQDEVIEHLNTILSAELATISQSFVHAKLCEHWGYERLHHAVRARSLEAMKAADRLIGHILYLDALPHVHRMPGVRLGETVPDQFASDLKAQRDLLTLLSHGVRYCAAAGDFTSRHLWEERVAQIDAQIEWLETQQASMDDTGLELYLADQLHHDH